MCKVRYKGLGAEIKTASFVCEVSVNFLRESNVSTSHCKRFGAKSTKSINIVLPAPAAVVILLNIYKTKEITEDQRLLHSKFLYVLFNFKRRLFITVADNYEREM